MKSGETAKRFSCTARGRSMDNWFLNAHKCRGRGGDFAPGNFFCETGWYGVSK